MSSSIPSYVFRGVEGSVKKVPLELPAELGPKEVLIRITHASLCGTDLHVIPHGAALGHEGVGIVEKIGSTVTQFKIGDRAGAGYDRTSGAMSGMFMEKLDLVLAHLEITVRALIMYIGVESFLHKIPDSLSSEDAAPLQCAGATVYSAIVSSTRPGDRVAILGIGGLGHLAIQFSAKLGFDTIVFSSTADKKDEAISLGANEFYLLNETEKLTKPINVLLVAGTRYPDWAKFLNKNVLARTATIVPLAAPYGNIELPAWPLFFGGYNLKSSLVAHRGIHDDMLDFAARHQVKPTIEKFDLSEEGLAKALERMQLGKLRYRGVLVASSAGP
ncbi:putative NADP-dependent alcohol dehydrogenase C 2 [Bisporella sp. PMI_857]|nr:putative NADP-dependent alcohol dehydrogenase C 2 [Bisporella sp. PMI_857]